MDMLKFSFIVPCYNVEKYLEECVKSLLSQTYINYEILLIDDGSTDQTCKICDSLQLKSDKVIAFHKKNGGLSDARNYGILHATGDYLVFVDSDDFIDKDSLSNFAKSADGQPDDILTSILQYYGPTDICCKDNESIYTISDHPDKNEVVDWLTHRAYSTWPSVKHVVSREFIIRNDLFFEKERLHEDLDWTCKVCMYATRFSICRTKWYFHRMNRKESITNTISAKHITDVIEMADNLIQSDMMKQQNRFVRENLTGRVIASVFSKIMQYRYVSEAERISIIICLQKHKRLLKYAKKLKHKAFSFAVGCFGEKRALEILSGIMDRVSNIIS